MTDRDEIERRLLRPSFLDELAARAVLTLAAVVAAVAAVGTILALWWSVVSP